MEEYGVFVALGIYGAAFAADFLSTIFAQDAQKREKNPIARYMSKFVGFRTSLVLVGAVGLSIQIVAYLVTGNMIVTYLMAVLHAYAAFSNLWHQKSASNTKHVETL